jgi:hypothetical protein
LLSLRLLEGDLSRLGFEPFGKRRKEFVPLCGTKAARPSERARASQFKPGDKIKVTAEGGGLVFKKK